MLLGCFAACKKRSPYGAVVVDQQGMEHVIMTDANGVTVVNDAGDLVEIMTNSADKKPITHPAGTGTTSADVNDQYETHAVTFPGIIEQGEKVEDAFCMVTLPAGWEQIGNNMLILRHKKTEAQVMIYTNIGGSVTEAVEELTENVKKLSPDGYTQNDVVFEGVTATRTQYKLGELTMISYLLLSPTGKVDRVTCTVDTDKFDEADVDALVQTIRFK